MNDDSTTTDVRVMAKAYYKLLTAIDWNDAVVLAGIREGLNKFLTSVYLKYCFKGTKLHYTTHYASERASAKMQQNDYTGLAFDHMVPKDHYQKKCEKRAAAGNLTVEYIEDLLTRYWFLATITSEEHSRLSRTNPPDWDGEDILARYNEARIDLLPCIRPA